MIYIPKRAVFIHIPRTGGNSITNAIASVCAGRGMDIIIGTGACFLQDWDMCSTHIPARRLMPHIPEWNDIFRFAIYRPDMERLESTKRLVQRDINNKIYDDPTCDKSWRDVLLSENKEFYWNDIMLQGVDFYTKDEKGESLGVELFHFNELNDKWPEICDKCQIPKCSLQVLNKA